MNEENALVPVDLNSLPANPNVSDEAFGAVARSSAFLPRLQLFWANNKECKDPKYGPFPMNHYGLVVGKDKILDLGKTVDVLPLGWRPKAFRIMDDGSIISKYNPKEEEFKRIMAKSDEPNSGCMFGPEFLVWVPVLKRFASFYMSSKSARFEAQNLKEKLDTRQAATLDSVFIPGKKFSWQAPQIKSCSSVFEAPTAEAVIEEVTRFNTPPESQVEAAEPDTANGAPRAR